MLGKGGIKISFDLNGSIAECISATVVLKQGFASYKHLFERQIIDGVRSLIGYCISLNT
jgi:hypothetical protein